MKKFFKQLAMDFSDKDYAHNYMESHAVSRLAAQIYALRKQRGWSQEDLSEKSGLAQERISKIESAEFSSLTMKTLHKLSRAFDVHLHISFESFSNGIVDIGNLHREQLEIVSRASNLETAFSNENEVGISDRPRTAVTGPSLVLMVIGSRAPQNFLILNASSPYALSNDTLPELRALDISRKAATIGGTS